MDKKHTMSKNSQQSNFEGDLKVLKRSKLSRNHEYSALVQAVAKFNRELKLSSLQCKDRSQLSQQWEDQQFFRILVRMMHEVTTTTGMKQKEDLKKVYQWYQTNKSVLHSQPHFKGASSREIYKRPVLKFAPDALKYYSTPSEKRKHKKVAFLSDGKARKKQQAEDEHLLEEVGEVSEDGSRVGQRPVTAPAGLHRPKVTNSLPRNIPSSSRPGSGYDDAGFTAGFVSDHISPSSPDVHMMQRPSSALGIMKQSQANDLESTSGDPALSDTHEGSQLTSAPSMQSLASVSVHLPHQDTPPDSARSNSDTQSHLQYSHSELESKSESSTMGRDGEPDMSAILKYKHPISSLVNPVARIQFDEELYHGGQSPDRRSRSPVKLQMHIDIPTDNTRSSRPTTAEEEKADNLQKWKDFQERQQYGQEVAAKQSFYGHGGLPANVRYASHEGGEMPEFYTQDVISSYAEEDRTNSPWMYQQSSNAITSPSLEQFYEITERHSPQPRPSSRSGRQSDANRRSPVRGYIPDEVAAVMRNSNSPGSNKEKSVKFEAVVDLANQVGDQLALQKEKLTPEPRHGYRQPTLKVAHPRPQSAKTASPTSPPPERGPPISTSGTSLADPSKILFAPPNSSRQSTCSSGDFTPRTKRGDPIILLPESSQYTVHFRKNERGLTDPYIPYALSKQGKVVPDQQRYKWRDDGFGNPTYYQVRSRASSAPGNRNLRSAGSSSSGYRPRTATEPSTKHEWSKPKTGESSKQRIPQAASHTTVSIGPQSLASMMMIQHLGNDNRRGRTRMGGPGYYLEEEFEASPPSIEYMSFTGPAKLTTRGQCDKPLSIPTDDCHLSDTSALNPPSQTSQLESLPSQEWYKQGSSGGVTEGQDITCSSQGYADSLNAGSERTDNQSLSQDLGDIDDMLNDSQNSQDLGSEMQSIGSDSGNFDHGNASDHLDNEDVSNPSHSNNASDPQYQSDNEGAHPDLQEENLTQNDETLSADIKSDFVGKFAEMENQNGISEDVAADADQSVNSPSIDHEDQGANVESSDPSEGRAEEDAQSEKSTDADFKTDIPSEDSMNIDMADESNESITTHEVHFQDEINGHQEGNCDGEIRQAPDQILNRHFLAVTRDSVDRPKSANPRLYGQAKEGRNHHGGKGRPASAEVGVRSVFTIEIDGSRGNPSSRSIQTVPIAYMSLTNDHRNQLQQRTLPLVDQRRPHFRGAPPMSPAIAKKPLTPRGTPRNSPTMSPRGSDSGGSPAHSRDMSPAGTRENSVYSATGSRSDSPMTIVLQANLDYLQETGSLEASMPNLMQMSRSSLWSEGPPEPPASVDDGWSDIHEATHGEASPMMYQLTPPEIQIQRPNSAPTSRSTSSLSPGSSSRPSSARVDRTSRSYTEKSPLAGMNSSTRPRTVSTSNGKEWKGRPLPMFGAAKDVEWEAKKNQRAQEAKTSVNIRDLFGGSAAKEYRKELERQERERWGKHQRDSRSMSKFYKDHLMRKEIALVQREDIFSRDWERNYLSDKMLKDRMRHDKMSELMRQQALANRKAMNMLKRIGPSVDIWELFNGGKRGVTKAQMKKAAVTIQKFVRGWVVRSMLEKVKQKSRVHAGSFKGFVKYYNQLMRKIARWHGVKKPLIHLDLWQMDAFMDRKRYYEYVFAKRAHPGDSITIKDLDGFFKECDHFPSKREIFNAISGATKKDGKKLDSKLTEKEVIEITFMIYVPQGSNLRLEDTRKSTWLNPLVDGKEAKKLMGSDSVEKAEYAKSLQVVFAAFQERQENEARIKKIEQKRKEDEVAAGENDKKK
ncbi:uncharacterized protein [Asterias amurensis]|uniref:uncharacterized protein isoform X1 n=1 Tax=Asterias amurensis TaxID=7602 RepID=UPI003AB84B5F